MVYAMPGLKSKKTGAIMNLIKNVTMAGLLEQAQTMSHAEIEASGYTVKTPWAFSQPITSQNIGTLVEIEYTSSHNKNHADELTGRVYLTGDIPIRPYAGIQDKITAFAIKTEDGATGRDDYIKMFDLCRTLAENIQKVLDNNKAVLQTDSQLEITVKYKKANYRVRLNDLIHRRNHWYKINPSTKKLTEQVIPKPARLECLLTARDKYQEILTDRKLQRLDTLIAETNGAAPTYKQRQELARNAKQ